MGKKSGPGRKKDAPNRSKAIREALAVAENAGKTNEEIAKIVEETLVGCVCTALHVSQCKSQMKAKLKPEETVVKELTTNDLLDFNLKVKAAGGMEKVAEAVTLVANLLALPYIGSYIERIDEAAMKVKELQASLAA